mmetsp:Transcript_19125/g.58957  ORF Transcript_19125/g.58957 Transcript_19125/m.58957 type:complete len:236 (+) Transcript_19125:24-731(+)
MFCLGPFPPPSQQRPSTTMTPRALLLVAWAAAQSTLALAPPTRVAEGHLTRRSFVRGTAPGLLLLVGTTAPLQPATADAEVIEPAQSRMGGQLEKYADVTRGFRIMKPAQWNMFEGEAGAYDVRFADLVDVAASVTISSSSYGGTSIDGLADLDKLAAKLGKSRGELMNKRERVSEGVLFYDYEFAPSADAYHELLSLSVAKNKLWQISAKAPSKLWDKKEKLFINVVGSFVPKL